MEELVVPVNRRNEVIRLAHLTLTGGHMRAQKTRDHHHHHIRFWYLRCCGCPGLRGRQHPATPHTRSPRIPV